MAGHRGIKTTNASVGRAGCRTWWFVTRSAAESSLHSLACIPHSRAAIGNIPRTAQAHNSRSSAGLPPATHYTKMNQAKITYSQEQLQRSNQATHAWTAAISEQAVDPSRGDALAAKVRLPPK